MHKGKKFTYRSKYEKKTRRKSRITEKKKAAYFDREFRLKSGTTLKKWKKQGHYNIYGRAW